MIAASRHRLGIIDRLLAFVDRLPGPAAVWWAGMGLALAAAGHLVVWLGITGRVGIIHNDVLAPALIFAWFAWLIQTLNRALP